MSRRLIKPFIVFRVRAFSQVRTPYPRSTLAVDSKKVIVTIRPLLERLTRPSEGECKVESVI